MNMQHRIHRRKEGMNMCAIAGLISLTAGDDTCSRMLETMRRRGPDDSGIWKDPSATLLHSRLAIVDLEGGRQPMELFYGQEHYILVYNGELYNTMEVRKELEHAGHVFSGHSDTEVVLHAYAHWGADCVKKFNGIFAFAVWEYEILSVAQHLQENRQVFLLSSDSAAKQAPLSALKYKPALSQAHT